MTQAAVLAASGSPGTTTGFKNRIINGAMTIDQRNAGASNSFSSSATYNTVDRYQAYQNTSGTATIQQVVDAPAGFYNSVKVTITGSATPAAGEVFQLQQIIEGYNISDLALGTASAKSMALSFWVKSSLTGQFGGAVQDGAAGYGFPFSYTISAANTWEYKTISITPPTSGSWGTTNSAGLRLYIDLGCGSNLLGTANTWASASYRGATGDTKLVSTNGATWYMTGLQLEVGTTATNFDFRDYTTELSLCQRYYTQSNLQTAAANLFSSTYSVYITSWNYSGITWIGQAQRFPVTMRTIPTCTLYTANIAQTSSGGNVSYYQGAWTVSNAAVHVSTNESYLGFTASGSGAGSTGNNLIQMNYTASAEL